MARKILLAVCALLLMAAALWALIRRDDCGLFPEILSPPPPHVPEAKGFEYFDQAESTFAIPVTITLPDAQAFVIGKVPATVPFRKDDFHVGPIWVEHLYGDAHPHNIRIRKADQPANALAFDLEVTGKVTVNFQLVVLHPTIGADFRGHISGTVSAGLAADWKPTSTQNIAIAIQSVHVEHLGDIASHVRGALEAEARKAALNLIEEAVNKGSPHIKQAAEGAWAKMHVSQRISQAPPAWLALQPAALSLSPLHVSLNDLGFRVGIRAKTRVYVEKEPPAVPLAPLPALVINPSLSSRYNIVLPVQASLAELVSVVNRSFEHKSFEEDGVTITVQHADVDAVGDTFVVSFDFCAKHGWFARGARGRLYATGRIRYDPASETVSVMDLDYTLESAAVLRAANWILKPRLLEEASNKAHLKIAPFLEKARTEAQRQITSMKPPRGIKAWKFTIDRPISLSDVRLEVGRLFLLLRVEGEAAVQL